MHRFTCTILVILCAFLSACDRPSEPAYQLDLEALKKTDPRHITYRQEGLIKCPLLNPSGLAFIPDDQSLALIDGKQLVQLALDGTTLHTYDLGGGITAVSSGPDGNIYVAGKTSINVLRPGNESALWARLPAGSFACAMAGNESRLWVADSNRGCVMAYDATGRLLYQIGTQKGPKGEPHFILPSRFFDLCSGPNGSLWVTNPGRHRLENYRADGSFLSSWGNAGPGLEAFCGCCNPTHIAVFPDSRFITVEKGLTRIKEYDQQGQFSGVVADASRLKNSGRGLDTVVLPENKVAVLDPEAGVIRIFGRK